VSYPQPWQPWHQQQQPWQQNPSAMLASHAERERAVDVLRAGFSEGRLQQDEFDKRVSRAYTARTAGELALLVADLPQGPLPLQSPAVPPVFRPALPPPTNGKAVASMVCGVLTTMTLGVTGFPAVVLGHIAQSEIRRNGEAGQGFAVAGLVLGWLSVTGWTLFLLLALLTT
jgi:hypothetical protein